MKLEMYKSGKWAPMPKKYLKPKIAELIAEKDFLLTASSGAISKFGKNNAKLGEEIAELKKENERLKRNE